MKPEFLIIDDKLTFLYTLKIYNIAMINVGNSEQRVYYFYQQSYRMLNLSDIAIALKHAGSLSNLFSQ